MEKKGYLLLADGQMFEGTRFGAEKDVYAELVFTTAMTGYLETLTDPSYEGQIVIQTFPTIGNYGVIPQDFESGKPGLSAYVVRECCENPSNFRCQGTLSDYLKEMGIPGLCGVDTRQLTRRIRNAGVMNAALLMEKTTGQMLFAQNEHEKLEPASVTKIMTLLLTMDAIDSGALAYDDVVTVSANAAGMGGSQVFLAEGEQITVEELLKCVCVSSGNDAAVALAEKVAGVTELFVEQMNNRARGLGMDDTHFANPTGLTAAGHVTSAYDIALMSRELLTKHPDIRNFTTIWTDSIRNGTFDLANTNKLIRWYDGATGLKTGYTASAGYCISATAEREGMELIAVVMKGETSDKRNTDAKALLNYGFSAYTLVSAAPEEPLPALPVTMGEAEQVGLTLPETGVTAVVEKAQASSLEYRVDLPETLAAPIQQGQQVGTLTLCSGDTEVLTVPILAAESVPGRSWGRMFTDLLKQAVFLA